MKKLIGRIKSRLLVITPILVLGILLIGVPLVFNHTRKHFWYISDISKYIYFLYAGLSLFFVGIVIIFRRIFTIFGISPKIVDAAATIIVAISASCIVIPLWLLFIVYLVVTEKYSQILFSYRYKVFKPLVLTSLYLFGVRIRQHGKLDKLVKLVCFNHTSWIDYLLICLVLGTEPWNVVSGINLYWNRTTLGNKLIAFTIGWLINRYSISIDRESDGSRVSTIRKTTRELDAGKRVGFSPEAGRVSKNDIIAFGTLLRKFKDGLFEAAWKRKESIQPVIFDWPVMYYGKDNGWWGAHLTYIDIYFLAAINPNDYKTFQEFRDACWNAMHQQLDYSEKIQKYVEELRIAQKNKKEAT